jgi:hypothetical protein
MIEAPTPNETVLVDEAGGHTLPPVLADRDLPIEATVVGPAGSGDELFVVTLDGKHGQRIQVHRDQLYAVRTAAMKFRSGKISLELASEAGVVVLEHDGSNGNGLTIDVPRGWAPDLEQFTLWCCRFLGMVMEDKPVFTVVSEPSARGDEEDSFSIALTGPIGDIERGTVLAPVPEAS